MHKLLVAVDGSDHARRALDYALKLAKENSRIALHIVTVQPEPNVYGEIQIYVTEEHMAQLQRQHSKDILDPALEAAREAGVAYTSDLDRQYGGEDRQACRGARVRWHCHRHAGPRGDW